MACARGCSWCRRGCCRPARRSPSTCCCRASAPRRSASPRLWGWLRSRFCCCCGLNILQPAARVDHAAHQAREALDIQKHHRAAGAVEEGGAVILAVLAAHHDAVRLLRCAQGTDELAETIGLVHTVSIYSINVPCQPVACLTEAARRLASSRASTSATIWSSASERMAFCAATLCTSRSTRSILGAPPNNARAAEDGLASPCAAAAYFSNGTRSFSCAPSARQSFTTQL